MSMVNYEKLLDKVSRSSNVEKEELERRVDAKQAKLSGLISKEGALQVIAAELGLNLDDEVFKIDELVPGMRKVNVTGKIIRTFPIRSFTTKAGKESKVMNMILADDTSNVRVVLWDTNHIALFENETLKEGSSVEIGNGSMRDNEIHLGSFSELKPSTEVFENVVTEKVVREKLIKDFAIGDSVKNRAFVVQIFDPRFFEVNPSTGKKLTDEEKSSGVQPEKRAILNVILDDGTESIRAVMFGEMVSKIGLANFDDSAIIAQQKENILGSELLFSGNVRRNSYFNNEEFIVDGIEEPNLDDLIRRLEK